MLREADGDGEQAAVSMQSPWEQRRPGGHTGQRQCHRGKELRFSKGFTCPIGTVPVLQPIPWSFR